MSIILFKSFFITQDLFFPFKVFGFWVLFISDMVFLVLEVVTADTLCTAHEIRRKPNIGTIGDIFAIEYVVRICNTSRHIAIRNILAC